MHDAGVGRDDAEVLEGVLAPAQEHVPLAVARELELRVQLERVRLREVVDLHGMIDDELDGLQRVDPLRIAAEPDDAVAHRGEVDDRRHAGEVLKEHARRHERDFLLQVGRRIPGRQRPDRVRLDELAVFATEQVLEQDLLRVREARNGRESGLLERRQAEDRETLAADFECGPCVEGIAGSHHSIIT